MEVLRCPLRERPLAGKGKGKGDKGKGDANAKKDERKVNREGDYPFDGVKSFVPTATEKTLARKNTPIDADERAMCWGASTKAGCKFSAADCRFSHRCMKLKGLHWALENELDRRGGHRMLKAPIPLKDIPGRCKARRKAAADAGRHLRLGALS